MSSTGQLLGALTAADVTADALVVTTDVADIIAEAVAAGSAVDLELFTAAGSERVLVIGDELRRGRINTDVADWPIATCATVVEVVPCPAVSTPAGQGTAETAGGSGSASGSTVAITGVGKGLTLSDAGVLSLAASGVEPGTVAGLTVDSCGRVTFIDTAFPLRTTQDPCCKPGE